MKNVFGVNSNPKIIFLLFLVFNKLSTIQTHNKWVFG